MNNEARIVEEDDAKRKIEGILALLDQKAKFARSTVTKYRMDDQEYSEWSARASGLEDAADEAREIAEISEQPQPARSGS